MTVAQEDIRPTAAVWGNLRAAETWVAVAEVQGEVIWRHPDLEPGRLIPAGTEVLRIDPADYELALAQSQADLAALEAEGAQLIAETANTARILELERERLALADQHPDIWQAYAALGKACATEGPLSDREKRLVKLALAVGASSEGAVHSHARRARSENIPEDAIAQVALLAIGPLGLPHAVAAKNWIEDGKP
ncbi:carboxymuconolactone decarboxylase family protein [Rhodobacteraceae bacterium N5(2021)]|uniref:Carboxymuconolactone decarboxylase family protein n=2 Tax=Gymnodinialimonas phycosphaerae TaxID=2841589 RepID=A0A975YHY6_9RHOB|nr:carboxymuconolactone decarboxylase family protein [Gymnodinialimonas phycosphaerae]MBY4891948.1 carboxymuconolactone decarboxylase family protein [Gymnodinialimonas phycosphaerae]